MDSEPNFALQAAKAKSLWASKSATHFKVVRDTLKTICVSVEICNYCEQNEANDIEHIYPASLFPSLAFEWNNYLLACKHCNSTFKLDKFAVLDNNGDLIDIPRGTEPPNTNGAFINPRNENPSDYMLVNTLSFKFEVSPALVEKKGINKAKSMFGI